MRNPTRTTLQTPVLSCRTNGVATIKRRVGYDAACIRHHAGMPYAIIMCSWEIYMDRLNLIQPTAWPIVDRNSERYVSILFISTLHDSENNSESAIPRDIFFYTFQLPTPSWIPRCSTWCSLALESGVSTRESRYSSEGSLAITQGYHRWVFHIYLQPWSDSIGLSTLSVHSFQIGNSRCPMLCLVVGNQALLWYLHRRCLPVSPFLDGDDAPCSTTAAPPCRWSGGLNRQNIYAEKIELGALSANSALPTSIVENIAASYTTPFTEMNNFEQQTRRASNNKEKVILQ